MNLKLLVTLIAASTFITLPTYAQEFNPNSEATERVVHGLKMGAICDIACRQMRSHPAFPVFFGLACNGVTNLLESPVRPTQNEYRNPQKNLDTPYPRYSQDTNNFEQFTNNKDKNRLQLANKGVCDVNPNLPSCK